MTLHVYVENEDGPDCVCGNATVVKFVDGVPGLMCLFHTSEAGVYSRLPPDMTEENWQSILAVSRAEDNDD
jgi:hypothetical protein